MKVYLGFVCSYDFCDNYNQVEVVFADEFKAMEWVLEFEPVEYDGITLEWREYKEYIVI